MNHGSFSGNPKTEWLPDGRNMRLLENFSFTDPDGRIWMAPKGSIINGASIPQTLWATVGSPYAGYYRNASVVHDVACNDSKISRREADIMFFHACRAGGCNPVDARILYGGVRVGAWSTFNIRALANADDDLTMKIHLISSEMRLLSGDVTIQQMDAAVEKYLA